ncbi:hypothetical protein [Pectobacterium sp. 21LCBS03]|uniref:hypothetical protein n=1 Tax=Pectobacterium sp. 21LCBS03 TaxID=2935858 RepID=UPI0020107636|nr:hypothetical protein [Pectobacterium sp. 21LCBS03]UPY96238.1 hypothetical protein MYB54_05895 [Pectobacterium sp. 21LCBS03]
MKTKDLILNYLKTHALANYTQLRVMGEVHGKTEGAIQCAIYDLVGLGHIRRTGMPKKFVFSIISREEVKLEGFDTTEHDPTMLMLNQQLKQVRGPIWNRL